MDTDYYTPTWAVESSVTRNMNTTDVGLILKFENNFLK